MCVCVEKEENIFYSDPGKWAGEGGLSRGSSGRHVGALSLRGDQAVVASVSVRRSLSGEQRQGCDVRKRLCGEALR